MFYLRTFDEQGERNETIGDKYSVVYRGVDAERFRAIFKYVFCKDHVADLDESADDSSKNIYGFLEGEGVGHVPLDKENRYYVMTGNGKTFHNLGC